MNRKEWRTIRLEQHVCLIKRMNEHEKFNSSQHRVQRCWETNLPIAPFFFTNIKWREQCPPRRIHSRSCWSQAGWKILNTTSIPSPIDFISMIWNRASASLSPTLHKPRGRSALPRSWSILAPKHQTYLFGVRQQNERSRSNDDEHHDG